MSSGLWELMQELDRQKRSYHEKLLSVDGELSLFLRSFQVYDLTIDISHLLIPEFYFTSMSLSLLFDLDLFELEPLNLEFTWRLPTLEEWLRGVSVVFEKALPDAATDVETFVEANIAPEHRESIIGTMPEKCVWGRSAYGECYADPLAVREFLRATQVLLLLKHPSVVQRRASLLALVRALDINEQLARSTHDRLSMVVAQHTECFTLDYSILDISRLCEPYPEVPGMGAVPFVDLDGNVREATVYKLADSQYGCVLDMSTLDFCYLLPEEDIYQHSPEPALQGVLDKLVRFRGRFMLTAPGLSNYVRGDEAVDHHRCERTNIWGELMGLRYMLEHEVESQLRQLMPELDPFERRKYVTAVLQLLGHRGKRHRWGYGTYRAMAEEELRAWWLEHWSAMGLDRGVLERLYDTLGPLLDALVRRKVELGRRLRLSRIGPAPRIAHR